MLVRFERRRFQFVVNTLYAGWTSKRSFVAKRKCLAKVNPQNTVHETVRIIGPLFLNGCTVHIGEGTFVGRAFATEGRGVVTIGKNCDIAPQVTVLTGTHKKGDSTRRAGEGVTTDVEIGDGTWIGACSIILPGVHIGKGCVIGAGAVVTKDVPDNTKAIGVPAKFFPLD